MNASTILHDEMTLEEKLAAIDMAMREQQEKFDAENGRKGIPTAPLDPADLTQCEGCQ